MLPPCVTICGTMNLVVPCLHDAKEWETLSVGVLELQNLLRG